MGCGCEHTLCSKMMMTARKIRKHTHISHKSTQINCICQYKPNSRSNSSSRSSSSGGDESSTYSKKESKSVMKKQTNIVHQLKPLTDAGLHSIQSPCHKIVFSLFALTDATESVLQTTNKQKRHTRERTAATKQKENL